MSEDTRLIDEALLFKALGSHAVPSLSEDFERRLQHEIDQAAGRKTRISPRPSFMLYYWLFACLTSVVVFALIGIVGGDAMNLVVASIGFCLLVAAILLSCARVDFAELIVASIRRSGGPA